jgi:hypothetical protein
MNIQEAKRIIAKCGFKAVKESNEEPKSIEEFLERKGNPLYGIYTADSENSRYAQTGCIAIADEKSGGITCYSFHAYPGYDKDEIVYNFGSGWGLNYGYAMSVADFFEKNSKSDIKKGRFDD